SILYGTYYLEEREKGRTCIGNDTVAMEITNIEEGFRRQDNRGIQSKKGSFILLFHIDISDVRSQMEPATALLGLQKMYGDMNMRFKSTKQAEAIKLALKREKAVLQA